MDEATGETTTWKLTPPKKRRGRRLTVKGLHDRLARSIRYPVPRNSVRFMVKGVETSALAARPSPVPFTERVEQHRELLRRRGTPLPAETHPPKGQAAGWFDDVIQCVPRSGRDVARQLARLCGDDSRVSVPIESLANAVGRRDRAGRESAYTRRGIECLIDAAWLRSEVTGSGRNIITTFYLLPGDRSVEFFPEDDDAWLEEDE